MKHSIINIALLFFLINNNASADIKLTFKTPLQLRRELRAATGTKATVKIAEKVTNAIAQKVAIVPTANSAPINKTPVEVSTVEIKITGTAVFQNKIKDALRLLKQKDSEGYSLVITKLIEIRQSQTDTQMSLNTRIAHFNIRDTNDIYWCACSLVHEAAHVIYAETFAQLQVWGTAAELFCIEKQALSAERVGAPAYLISYLKSLDGNHWKK